MTPRKTSRTGGNAIGTLIIFVVVVIMGACFAVTGFDPLGLFNGNQGTPTEDINFPTDIPATDEPNVPVQPSNGDWYDLYFVTPIRLNEATELAYSKKIPADVYKGSLTERLIQEINAAKKTIHIASFETNLTDVANALIQAKKRGVEVQWMTDDEHGIDADGESGHGQFALMKKSKIEIKDDQRSGLMHNKFWIFDKKVVITGSTNITVSGMFEQNNNMIIIRSAELASIYETQFAEIWAGEISPKAPSDVAGQLVTIEGTKIQALFSPEDDVIQNILPYIQKARRSIQFMAFSFTQPDLGDAMLARMKAGVKVTGIFETSGSETEFSRMSPLACAGASVRQDGNPSFLHHKVIVIDNRYVITGSLNFSDSANKQNSENVIVIDNPTIAKSYAEEIKRVWSIASDPDPSEIQCK